MANYLRYILENTQALRVSDFESVQSGQTETVRYIPGSAIRGVVVNALAGQECFEELKPILFSDEIAYLNAYPVSGGHALIPSPKGFYEDKVIAEGRKSVQNVVINGEFPDGMKRASLGNFCFMEDGCIYYYPVKICSDMKVLVNPGKGQKRNVFRLEMIASGQTFEGYIRLTGNDKVDEKIAELFRVSKTIKIGSARSAGSGSCKIVFSEISEHPKNNQLFFDAEGECYIMLLSDTLMRDTYGEYCGIDLVSLQNDLGVENMEILFASTTVRTLHGYNRTLGTRLPTAPVYASGSVFHLKYNGTISKERMESICDRGIGVRRNEGMGRITFLQNYEQIRFKEAGNVSGKTEIYRGALSEEDRETVECVARSYYHNCLETAMEEYVLTHPLKKKGVKNSQLGVIESRLLQYQYSSEKAVAALEDYFGHMEKREQDRKVQKETASLREISRQVMTILKTPIEKTVFGGKDAFRIPGQVMGIRTDKLLNANGNDGDSENMRCRIRLLISMIRFDRKRRDGQ